MKTRIQKLLVCAALVGAATLVQAQFPYTDNGNGTCTITGYTGPGGAVTIPSSIAGLSVLRIGDDAFYGYSSLTSVSIPDSVTWIGEGAFDDCSSLTSVSIPDSVTSIGGGAFERCPSLTSVTIPNSVTSIGGYAFYDCISLTSVAIPASVTSIGVRPFYDCHFLTAITVDPANSFYSSVDGVLFNKNQTTLIESPGGRVGSYTIPASVTSIGDDAFADCYGLTSVTIPNSVTSIGIYAFGYCSSLNSVTMPDSVTFIGREAFVFCSSLTSVSIGRGITRIEGAVFGYCASLTAAYFLGNAPRTIGGLFIRDSGIDPVTVYYLPGATGWGPLFSGAPTELWNPQANASGITGGHFGFNITGPSNTVIVVEACTDLAQPVWLPVSTNALDGGGASSFSDSQSGNYPARFYRFRSP